RLSRAKESGDSCPETLFDPLFPRDIPTCSRRRCRRFSRRVSERCPYRVGSRDWRAASATDPGPPRRTTKVRLLRRSCAQEDEHLARANESASAVRPTLAMKAQASAGGAAASDAETVAPRRVFATKGDAPGISALRKFATFDSFVVGSCNRLAQASAKMAIE